MDPALSDSLGLCRNPSCESKRHGDETRCFRHTVHFMLHRKKALPGRKLGARDEEKLDKLTLELRLHYNLILSRDREPNSKQQLLMEAYRLRRDLGIAWGGPSGMMALAEAIGDLERMAEKEAACSPSPK